ncbi:MAG: N-acetyltransferase [Woeseiaceae bacterium]|nr:N-acetyltransferase [Woeseiaceae bacterium]
MRLTVHDAIADIAAAEWNAVAGDEYPFLRHEFLLAAEQTGSVSADAGWIPRHLTVEKDGTLLGAMPLYEKDHSWGEFVFDWAWARAYEHAGLPYYPKLVSAVPFTPAPSRRLLLAENAGADVARVLIDGAIALAEKTGCSSLHILFPLEDELPLFRDAGLRVRKDCQFHWENRDYADFDAFLQTFTAVKRKKARRDRRRVSEAGIQFRRLRGADLDKDTWETVFRMISITFMRRGSLPYYDLDFFLRIAAALPDNILVILAEQDGQPIAAAVFYESASTLYGRYWGSTGYHNALHFETCYYQGIEYCIDKGLQLFEPGTQGEHKISRGFAPVYTWSAHWLAHPEFLSAIGDYLEEEGHHVDRYVDAVDSHSPYRDDREPT